jgi:LPS-assembly lipoprotein
VLQAWVRGVVACLQGRVAAAAGQARETRRKYVPAIVLAALALAGCGFQLQGTSALPEAGRSVHIRTPDELTPFAIELRRAIERSGGEIVATPEAAQTVVRIVRDRSGRRVLSVSARNTPQEFEVFYEIEYAVDRDGVEVLGGQPLRLVRNMSFEESQLLAKQREQAILEEAMARDLATLVVRRLGSLEK